MGNKVFEGTLWIRGDEADRNVRFRVEGVWEVDLAGFESRLRNDVLLCSEDQPYWLRIGGL